MEIFLKRNHGFELIFKAENVSVTEDIEERIYGKTADGKTDFSNVGRDIKTDALEQVAILDDMIYYRQAEFDSSALIGRLFAKLPKDVAVFLIGKLKSDYDTEEHHQERGNNQ